MVPPSMTKLPLIINVTPKSTVSVLPELRVRPTIVHAFELESHVPLIASHALLESPTCNSKDVAFGGGDVTVIVACGAFALPLDESVTVRSS